MEAVRRTASRLGNRPATCRNYYIHPAVFDAYTSGILVKMINVPAERSALHPEEETVMALLRKMLPLVSAKAA